MDDQGRFGAVGSLPGNQVHLINGYILTVPLVRVDCKNPIQVAASLLSSWKDTLRLGRVNPLLLVGQGAYQYALERQVGSPGTPLISGNKTTFL